MLNELKRKKRGQQLNGACRCCHMKNHFSKNRFARMLEMISYFLSGAVVVFYLNNGFLTGFTGPSIVSTSVNTHNKENKENPQICIYMIFHDSSRRNSWPLNTGMSMSADGGSFPLHISLRSRGTLDNTVYVFPVSTIWTWSAVFGKQSMPPPACCLSFQAARAPSPPPPPAAERSGSHVQAPLEKKCRPETPVCPCPAESLSVKLALLNVGTLASDGRSHLEHLDEHGALNLQ